MKKMIITDRICSSLPQRGGGADSITNGQWEVGQVYVRFNQSHDNK